MARLARVVLPGVVHHVTQRGVRSMNIFPGNSDRTAYLRLLCDQALKKDMQFLGYCLMNNHVHFLVIPSHEDDLRAVFGEAHRLYTRRINFRTKTRGYLFQGRFFSCPMDSNHLLSAARYVERNPVRAGICASPKDYQWSSARYNLGLTNINLLIQSKHPLYGEPDEWENWLNEDPENADLLRKHFRTGRPLGDKHFIRQAEKITGRSLMPKKSGPKPKN